MVELREMAAILGLAQTLAKSGLTVVPAYARYSDRGIAGGWERVDRCSCTAWAHTLPETIGRVPLEELETAIRTTMSLPMTP